MGVLSGTGFVVFVALGAAALAASGGMDGLYSLIQRRIPAHSQSFNFILTPDDSILDTFTLSDADPHSQGNTQINIECTSISACARGLYM